MKKVGETTRSAIKTVAAAVLLIAVWFDAVQAQEPALVHVGTVKTEPLRQTVPVIGRLVSLRSGDIATRIDAPVIELRVEVGDRLSKGQVIAVLDAETLKADELLAKSELDEAVADYDTWNAEADLARTELKRQGGLRKSVAFSQAKFEDAQKSVAVADSKVKRAQANVEIKRAALKRKKLDVEYATIRAPYEGVVVQRHTEAGAFVNRGDAVVRMIGDRLLEVEAQVPFKRLVGLPAGRTVDIRLDDGSAHQAVVRAILPAENPLTRTRTVRFQLKLGEQYRPLAESQSVTVSVPIGADRDVLTVHKDAILKQPQGAVVFVVTDGKAMPRPVQLGAEIGSRIEVLNGLKLEDVVVVRGNERLQPGSPVMVQKG